MRTQGHFNRSICLAAAFAAFSAVPAVFASTATLTVEDAPYLQRMCWPRTTTARTGRATPFTPIPPVLRPTDTAQSFTVSSTYDLTDFVVRGNGAGWRRWERRYIAFPS